MVFVVDNSRAVLEQQVVEKATEIALESLKDIEHGGLDIIKDAVSKGVDEVNTDFMYSNVWNKVFRHVLVKLENNHQLAHVLMI